MNFNATRPGAHADLPRRRLPWLEVTLITGFLFFVLLGLASLAAFFLLRSDRIDDVANASNATLASTFDSTALVPQLALMQLAGDPSVALAYQASAAGELDVAAAIALYTAELPASQRLALLLHVGERYKDADRVDEAASLFQHALSVAILDTQLSAQARAQALVQIATALATLELPDAARAAANQAVAVAAQTPDMLPIERSRIFEALKPAVHALDDADFSAQINEFARNPFMQTSGADLAPLWLPTITAPAPTELLSAAIAARTQAARLLAERLLATGGIDIEPERKALAAALLAEDLARAEAYRTALAAGLPLAQQLGVLLDHRAWVALKLRIAQGGFGMSVVPEWEQNADALAQELSTLTASAKPLFDAQANTLADPIEKGMLQTEGLRWLALQSMLGYFVTGDRAELDSQLRFFQGELARLGRALALPITYQADSDTPGFRYQPLP
jgi:hypothetical protein